MVGSICCLYDGEEKIYDCHVILKEGNVIIAQDLFGTIYGRFTEDIYMQIL
jgi:hypothetical protein